MNREIIFRAKQPHNGEWMEGYFSKDYAGLAYITTLDGVSTGVVDESTLGQFTGLTDKNGGRIWEGDLVRYEAIVKTDSEGNNAFFIGSIEYWSGSVGCGWRYKSGRSTMMIKTSHPWRMEVIGNIHEEREVKNG